ncbi:MAG: sodium:proton antiporter [Candidatus Hydrogenedentes bacterium]|nr:sodium:proton antiporter [Candidatus Hydrogenedentota bacterium]
MDTALLVGLSSIIVLGIAAQWLSWRFHMPAILLLLVTGLVAGPGTGLIQPDRIFGDLLFPLVSLSVGLILFEGGLSLKLSELREIGTTLRNLIVIGSTVTWFFGAMSAHYILGLDLRLSILLGAILVVTGPTVIIPLLRHVRPGGQVGSILKWEGMLIDPLGATLALLVFQGMLIDGRTEATREIVFAILRTVGFGGAAGLAGAFFLTFSLKRYWIPDFLQNPVSIMAVVAVFTVSNWAQHESGLLAVTVMGIYLANQRSVDIFHIVEFKENLRVLLISGLFIVLAARLSIEDIRGLPVRGILFVAVLILIARPVGVALSTIGTGLSWRERVFLAWIAPRGIVAASVASIFSLRLQEDGYTEAALLAPMTFMVILGTVTICSITAAPLARWLNVAEPHPNGLVFVGAQPWVRALASAFHAEGVPVLIADTNRENISAARMAGLRTYYGNILSEHGIGQADFGGIGRLLALTPNNETNSLMAIHFTELFDRAEVYQLAAGDAQSKQRQDIPERLRGRELFGPKNTFARLNSLFNSGGEIKRTPLTDTFSYDDFKEHYGPDAVPLALLDSEGTPRLITSIDPPKPQSGQLLFSLVMPDSNQEES